MGMKDPTGTDIKTVFIKATVSSANSKTIDVVLSLGIEKPRNTTSTFTVLPKLSPK